MKKKGWLYICFGYALLLMSVSLCVACGGNDDDGRDVTPVDPPAPETVFENKTFTVNGVSFTMVAVKGGSFMMGASDDDEEARDNEKPSHKVTLDDFYIGETEVTQELWCVVMGGNNPSASPQIDPQLPLNNASREHCKRFIEVLNMLTGQNFRLPTEAEWEYAARGGNKSNHYKYSGSNDIGEVAWYIENSDEEDEDFFWPSLRVRKVAQKKANELGLYDMSGNVNEWCEDSYIGPEVSMPNYYSISPEYNPCCTLADVGGLIIPVCRGGGYLQEAKKCRVTSRGYNEQSSKNIGFRLAL